MEEEIRTFDTGATRDTDVSKPNYIKALCPLVLRRYVAYLDKHRLQPNGSMRDFDNWKQGIPKQAYMEGLGRHEIAVWLLHEGYQASDNHGLVNIEDALCGVIFNANGYLHEILKGKEVEDEDEDDSDSPVKLRLKSAAEMDAAGRAGQEVEKRQPPSTEWHCDRHKTTGIGDSCPVCRRQRAQQA